MDRDVHVIILFGFYTERASMGKDVGVCVPMAG
jgi:hypothetical protein